MTYALDANIVSFLLRPKHNPDVVNHFETEIYDRNQAYVIPPVSLYEVAWYLMLKRSYGQLRLLREITNRAIAKADMSEDTFWLAAQLRADLAERGQPIDGNDVLIAAYCIVNDYILVTDNRKHFGRIARLRCVNWRDESR